MVQIDDFEKWNEEMFKKYATASRIFHSSSIVRFITNQRIKKIIKILGYKEDESLVELGCGSGNILRNFKKGNVTGIELSETGVKLAKKNCLNARIIKGDAQTINLDKKFDKIICSEVLEHLPDPSKVIDNIIRMSKKKSVIVISIPNERFVDFFRNLFIRSGLFSIFFKNCDQNMEWHLHKTGKKFFKKLVKEKLRIIKTKPSPFFFFPYDYIFKCRIM